LPAAASSFPFFSFTFTKTHSNPLKEKSRINKLFQRMNPNPFHFQNREQPGGRLGFGVGFYSISHWRTANQVQMVNVDDRTTTDDDGDPKPRMKPAVSSKPSRDGERNTEDSREKRERANREMLVGFKCSAGFLCDEFRVVVCVEIS
jgi:hypothetical protein